MKFSVIDFIVNKKQELTKKEINLLIEAYRVYLSKLNGKDELDSFLEVINKTSDKVIKNIDVLEDKDKNFKKAKNIVEATISSDIDMVLIYRFKRLIGMARIEKNDTDIRVLDVVFYKLDKNKERKIWANTIKYIENYYNNYRKIYLEIPYYEGPLLYRAKDLGYEENPEDIIISKDTKNYILNKELGRKDNDK